MKSTKTPLVAKATRYALAVVNGLEVACLLVIKACQRHLDDLKREDLFYDVGEETRYLKFCGFMKHVKGQARGQYFKPAPFQIFIAGSILCWRRTKTKLRRFSRAFVELARKNAKTFLAGSIIAWTMIQKTSDSGEFYSAATTQKQASQVYKYLKQIFRGSPEMKREFVFKYGKMFSRRRDSFFENLPANSEKLDGLMPQIAFGDEVHEWKGRGLRDVLDSSFGSTLEGLFLMVTTSGFNIDSVWWEEREDAVKILQGEEEDDEVFAFIATLDEGEEKNPFNPVVWKKANPGLGITKPLSYMERKAKQAKRSPGKKPNFLVKELNVPAQSGSKWIDEEILERNFSHVIDEKDLIGRKCHGGIDLASTGDIAGYVLVFEPDGPGDRYQILPRLFIAEDKVRERSEADQAMYEEWIEEGWIIATPGTTIDYDHIEESISDDNQTFDIEGFGFDPWNASHIVDHLEKAGLDMTKFMQGKALGWCLLEFEVMLEKGLINHGNHPVWLWMMRHAVTADYNGVRWVCRKLSVGKIDAVIMTKIAIGKRLIGKTKTSKKGSVYDERELEEV